MDDVQGHFWIHNQGLVVSHSYKTEFHGMDSLTALS